MKRLLFVVLVIVALPVLLLACSRFGNAPEPLPPQSVSAGRLAAGPYAVTRFDERFVDSARPTAPNGRYEGAAERALPGTVWYPDDAREAVPLLLFSHGFTSMRSNGAYMAEHLASHGYAVAAVDYPLTNMRTPGGPNVRDVINQPGDITFLIDTLLAYSADAGHRLSGVLDADRIGVFGISLGGLTSTLVAYHPQWRDPRVGAALSIAGPAAFFTERFFAGVELPFLMLAGDLDALVPYASNAAPIPDKVPGGGLLTISGASHTGFSGGMVWFGALRNPDAIGCFAVLRNIDTEEIDDWAALLGGPEEGFDFSVDNELCTVDPLPEAMNIMRQQVITRLAVTAFFDSVFASGQEDRRAAATFLRSTLPAELPEASYRGP